MTETFGYDIHLASDVMSVRLESQLLELGFVRDAFIGGTTGVVHPCHYSNHPGTQAESAFRWQRALEILRDVTGSEFHGYAEAEVTPPRFRVVLPWQDFDASVPFPLTRLSYEECPLGRHKDFDIHVTADLATIDSRLKQLLEDRINFNYVDIRKPSGKVVRVYTFQPLGTKVSTSVFDVLLAYFQTAGGLEGKIKLEVCTHFARFPEHAVVCPVVTQLHAAPASNA